MRLAYLIHESPSGRILLVVFAILFTLCVGPANSASEPGTIIIVLKAEPINLDPGNNTRAIEGNVMQKNIVETLTERNPTDSSITPGLAHSWKQIDANTWQFFLRKGVKFHDGTDFNAEAVLFSLKRIYDKGTLSSTGSKFFAGVKMEGRSLDSHAVEIKLDKPEPLLLTLMGVLPICSPNTPTGKPTRNPIGTGPYKLVKWDAGTQIILEHFDGYWGKRPQVKKAIYVWRTESSVRASMLLTGEADLAPVIAKEHANRPDMDYSYLDSETSFFRIGGAWEPPLNDRRFRMALNYAVDRGAIRGSLLSEDVIPATQLIGPSIFGYNPDLKVWPHDPKKARELLDEARKGGVPVDKEILIVVRIGDYPGAAEVIEAVMTMWKALGLNVKIRMFERAAARAYSDKPYPTNVGPYIMHKMHDNNYGDAVFTTPNFQCKGYVSSMCDKEVDDLIEKAQVATGEERKNFWKAAFKRIHEEIVPNVTMFHMVAYARVGNRINYKPSMATNNEIKLADITFK